jgi:hypothetical protein
MIKALIKLGIEGMYLNIVKTIYEKPLLKIILKWGKTKNISSKVRNETRVFTLPSLIQHSLGIPSQNNKKEEEIKGIHTGKEEIKISLFADNIKRSKKLHQKNSNS